MNSSIRSSRCGLLYVFVTGASLVLTNSLAAEEPLRWKFEAGDKFNYVMIQDMDMNMNAGPAGQMKTEVHQTMDMTWDVQSVNDAGEAVIQQKLDRVKMQMTGSMGQNIDYDSDAEGPAEGMAAMVAPLYDAMTEGHFEVTMTARGEVRDVKMPPEVLEALKNIPGAAAMGDMATPEGFQKMIMQGALVLPEETPKPGEKWSNTVTMDNQMTGKQTVETSYKFEGTREVGDATMAVFRPSIKMEFEGNPMMQMKVTKQESNGEVLFNQDEGRLDSTTLEQDMTMELTASGQAMEQQIKQKIEVKVTPKE